jgi:hypothetical protein
MSAVDVGQRAALHLDKWIKYRLALWAAKTIEVERSPDMGYLATVGAVDLPRHIHDEGFEVLASDLPEAGSADIGVSPDAVA